jgi:hypothetical protein
MLSNAKLKSIGGLMKAWRHYWHGKQQEQGLFMSDYYLLTYQ